MTAPPLSPAEQATVDRFEAAPDPYACDVCDGAGTVLALHMEPPKTMLAPLGWYRTSCPGCPS